MADHPKIESELSRIEEAATWSQQGQFEQAKTWQRVHLWLAVPAAVVAALSGGGLLADEISTTAAGAGALLSAALGGVVAALAPGERSATCRAIANRYLALQGAARRAREIDLPQQTFDEARSSLGDLTEVQDEINAAAPVISDRAYGRARKNIEGQGGQTYKVDVDG